MKLVIKYKNQAVMSLLSVKTLTDIYLGMLKKMKISFIIPSFNSEKTIASCIDLILGQKNAMDELIIIDNGSNDKTIDIVKKSGIKKIYVNTQYNISALRNLGVSKSS